MLKYLIAFILVFSAGFSEIEKERILESFFRTLIEHSEAGYVIYGVKPVCIVGFTVEDQFIQENELNLLEVNLYEGAKVWKKLNPHHNNLIIHIYEQPDSLVPQYKHLLVINRALFLETVQKNLSLFQSILGPGVNPASLLDELLRSSSTWHQTLKNSKILIGILLGFGANNSIHVSRLEDLNDYLFQGEDIPYKSKVEYLGIKDKAYLNYLLLCKSKKVTERMNPSFGYKSLQDEYISLNSKLEIPSTKLVKEKPEFIFGRIKDDKETEQLIETLEATQKKIQKLLSSETFLNDLLQEFQCSKLSNNLDTNLVSHDLVKLVAAHIWHMIEDEDKSYQDNFIQGMGSTETPNRHDFDYDRFDALNLIGKNLSTTSKLFKKLDEDERYSKILPGKLYYRTLKAGSDECLKGATKALLSYTFKDYEDNILVERKEQSIDLTEIIPGFAKGIMEMGKGEIREIIIHPCLSYGLNTPFEKGIALKAIVQLHDFDSNVQPYEHKEFDLTIHEEDAVEGQNTSAFNRGFNMWKHFEKSNLYTLSQVLEQISNFRNGEDYKKYLNRDLINYLHWNIYHSKAIEEGATLF